MMRTPNKLIETEQEECSAKFHPPSGKLAAVTRKGNELQTLINEQTKNEIHFKITYHESKQKNRRSQGSMRRARFGRKWNSGKKSMVGEELHADR